MKIERPKEKPMSKEVEDIIKDEKFNEEVASLMDTKISEITGKKVLVPNDETEEKLEKLIRIKFNKKLADELCEEILG